MRLAGRMVNVDGNGIISIRFRKLSDVINSDDLPGLRRSFLGLASGFGMSCVLVPLTDVTTSDIVLDKGSHARPPVVARD